MLGGKVMRLYVEFDINNFVAWSGEVDTKNRIIEEGKADLYNEIAEEIIEAGKADLFNAILEDILQDGRTETEMNDFLWFDDEQMFEWLGISDDEEEETQIKL